MTDVYIVEADPEDRRGNGIWGVFTSYRRAVATLRAYGLRPWEPEEHHADDPEHETPRARDERVIALYEADYKFDHRRRKRLTARRPT